MRTRLTRASSSAFFPVLALAAASALFPLAASSQAPQGAYGFLGGFNHEAAASDPSGVHKYSEDLIELIVPDKAGKGYSNSLADRLARAEQKARKGKGKLVPEADIVRSFNDLMRSTGAPPSLKADEASIRRFRDRSASVPSLSALFSADRNGTNCNPGEAVLLLYLLIYNDGGISEHILDQFAPSRQEGEGGEGFSVFSGSIDTLNQGARGFLTDYASKHRRHDTAKLFNNVAHTLGF